MASIEVRPEIAGTVWKVKVRPGDKIGGGGTLILVDPVSDDQVVAVLEG